MYFQESDAIVRDHPDLQMAVAQIDRCLSTVASAASLRVSDFACALNIDQNQAHAVFELMVKSGVLHSEVMIECDRCRNLLAESMARDANHEEQRLECSDCGYSIPRKPTQLRIHRMTELALVRTRRNVLSREAWLREAFGELHLEEPLPERAQEILVALLELCAFSSDARKSAEEIALKAVNKKSAANSLKPVLKDLRKRGLVCAKRNRGGGYWLTPLGRERAEAISQRNRLRSKPISTPIAHR
jgi:DNA-binding IscR family transcriptional regulator